jgi:hypothetical protein
VLSRLAAQVVYRSPANFTGGTHHTTYHLRTDLLTLYHFSSTGRKGPYAGYYVQIEPNGGSFVGKYCFPPCTIRGYAHVRLPMPVLPSVVWQTLERERQRHTQRERETDYPYEHTWTRNGRGV